MRRCRARTEDEQPNPCEAISGPWWLWPLLHQPVGVSRPEECLRVIRRKPKGVFLCCKAAISAARETIASIDGDAPAR